MCQHKFLQLRSKRYLLCLGSRLFDLFYEESPQLQINKPNLKHPLSLHSTSECLFVWHFSHQGWGREGFKKPFFNQPFLFGPPSLSLFGGAPTEHLCIDNSQPWNSNQKTDSHNCLIKACSSNHLVRPPQTVRAREKERSSCHVASACLSFKFLSDAVCSVLIFYRGFILRCAITIRPQLLRITHL